MRELTFVVEGDVNTRIRIAEQIGGGLLFEMEVLGGSGGIADLRGLFFDVSDESLLGGLSVAGEHVTGSVFQSDKVTNLGNGANVNGQVVKELGKFDGGVEFGTAGASPDFVTTTSFVISHATTGLTLDLFNLQDFAVRMTSTGEKNGGTAPAAPDAIDDAFTTDEDSPAGAALLANDIDLDGQVLTVVEVDGDPARVGTPFAVAGGGLMTVMPDGTSSFDPNGAYDYLAVGESTTETVSYRVFDGDGGYDTATLTVTITGVNDAPVISIAAGDAAMAAIAETNAGIAAAGTLTLTDVDRTDHVDVAVVSVSTSGKDDDPLTPGNAALQAMLTLTPLAVLDATEQVDGFSWSFDSGAATFDHLSVRDALVLDYTIRATDIHGATDDQVVRVTVTGTNDRPVAEAIALGIGEDDASVSGAFVGSDLDSTDVLSFEIMSAPTDASGNEYGSVVNYGDGTFSFSPGDQFQFLEAGETRDVTFKYRAVDNSAAANAASVEQTVTVTVAGAYDAPVTMAGELLFESLDQSMFGTGPAINLDISDLIPDLPFLGLQWDESFNATIFNSITLSGDVLEGVLDGIEAVANFFVDAGCTIAGWFGGDCGDDHGVELPSSITIPGISMSGSTSGKVGLQPFFSLTSGEIDSTIPVDVVFTAPRQVEPGDTFTLGSVYSVDGGATFSTQSPGLEFGVDFVFQLAANAGVSIGGAYHTLLPSFDIDETVNLFSFASGDLSFATDLAPVPASVELSFPDIRTTGSLTDPDTLHAHGKDDLAVLDLDLDALLSMIPYVPPLGVSLDEGLTYSIAGETLNLISVEANLDLIAANLINTLSVVQDFTLDIEDLPLMALFEDGSSLTGLSLGDDLTVNAPTGFDADVDGDADGFIDFDITVDMDAVLDSLTTLGFSMELALGVLRATAGITSDFASNLPSFNLFGTDDGFLWSDSYEFLDTDNFATLYEDQFGVEGFDQETFSGWYDIA